jgi:putative protein-disulfide isomerase
MGPTLYYCYDAYCGWCYGFSPAIKRIAVEYKDRLAFEVLSGGMIVPAEPRPISIMAGYIQKTYKTVEEHTGIKFGEDWLWHIFNPDKSDWFPNSEKPGIALSVFKDYHHDQVISFATDLSYALHYEGRDLCDEEAYHHLLEKYAIPEEEFYKKLKSPAYKEKAYTEFALMKQLQVMGFPTVFLQVSESKFYLLARGYTAYEALKNGIDQALRTVDGENGGTPAIL